MQAAAEAAGAGAIGMRADVTREDDMVAMVDRVLDEFEQIDILLDNAVIPGQDLHVWEQRLDNWNAVFAICIAAQMLAAREVLKRSMLERRTGSIVNLSSTAGWHGMPRRSHYVSAKAGLRALTKVIATEAGPYGVRCNCLVPGGIETDLWTNLALFLASDESRTITGQSINCDAGSVMIG